MVIRGIVYYCYTNITWFSDTQMLLQSFASNELRRIVQMGSDLLVASFCSTCDRSRSEILPARVLSPAWSLNVVTHRTHLAGNCQNLMESPDCQ